MGVCVLYAPVGKEKMVSEAWGVRCRVGETKMGNDCECQLSGGRWEGVGWASSSSRDACEV